MLAHVFSRGVICSCLILAVQLGSRSNRVALPRRSRYRYFAVNYRQKTRHVMIGMPSCHVKRAQVPFPSKSYRRRRRRRLDILMITLCSLPFYVQLTNRRLHSASRNVLPREIRRSSPMADRKYTKTMSQMRNFI